MKTIISLILVLLFQTNVFAIWVSPSFHDPNFPAAAGEYIMPAWTSSDSHLVASEDYWDNCANAYDDDTATYANEKAPLQQSLELYFSSPIVTDRCRIYAVMEFKGDEIDPTLRIYAWVNNDWILVDSGEIPKNAWYEHYIYKGPQDVYVLSKIKIEANAIADYELRVCEFQLYLIPEPSTLLLLGLGIMFLRKPKS